MPYCAALAQQKSAGGAMVCAVYLSIIYMQAAYIIQVQEGEGYPFEGTKEYCSRVVVRKSLIISNPEEHQYIHNNIHTLLAMDCPYIIRIVRVLERRGKAFLIDYEYVPDHLSRHSRLNDSNFPLKLREQLSEVATYLCRAGIRLPLLADELGINLEGHLKVFLPCRFERPTGEHRHKLSSYYQAQIQKIMEHLLTLGRKANSELSDYSYRLDKKITRIEHKLNCRKRRQSKGLSSPDREQDKKGSPDESQASEGSYSSQSLIERVNKQIRPRVHKSSFNGFPTTSHKLLESAPREDSLKKRLEKALQKTQEAFKIYGKFQSRSRF